jgi:hypothetical protein
MGPRGGETGGCPTRHQWESETQSRPVPPPLTTPLSLYPESPRFQLAQRPLVRAPVLSLSPADSAPLDSLQSTGNGPRALPRLVLYFRRSPDRVGLCWFDFFLILLYGSRAELIWTGPPRFGLGKGFGGRGV